MYDFPIFMPGLTTGKLKSQPKVIYTSSVILVNTGVQNFRKFSQQADTGAFSERAIRNRAPLLLLTVMGIPQTDLCALP